MAQLTVLLDHATVESGGLLSGAVLIDSGARGDAIVELCVRLVGIDGQGATRVLTQEMLMPARAIRVPFSWSLPFGMKPTSERIRYEVHAIAKTTRRREERASSGLHVLATVPRIPMARTPSHATT